MDSFTKTIELDFSIPGKNIQKLNQTFKKAGILDIGDSLRRGSFGNMMSSFDRLKSGVTMSGANSSVMPAWMKGTVAILGTGIELVRGIFGQVKKYLPSLDDIKSGADNILKYSKLSNQNVREQALMYGFNPAQNYAYTKSMDFLGLDSFEDLYWLNEQETEKFRERFEAYVKQFESLSDADILSSYQELEWTKNELMEELQYTGLKFLADNKDTLLWAFDKITDFFSLILDVAQTLSKWFGKDENGNSFVDRVSHNYQQISLMTNDVYNVGSPEAAMAIQANKYGFLQTSTNVGGR